MVRLAAALILIAALTAKGNAQDAPVTTLHTLVRLTTIDVVVTDGKGNPVHDLKPEDFAVLENKAQQKIGSFEEHKTTTTTYDKPAPGTFTNATAARGGVSNVLLIDWLNTPPTDQRFMRDQLIKFVAAQPAGTRTAIFALTSTIHLLQDFTADPAILKLALLQMGTKYSPLLGSTTFASDPSVQTLADRLQGMSGESSTLQSDLADKIATMNDFTARESGQAARNNALFTMEGLVDVSRYLAGVNGRKNLFWVSGGFPSFIQRDPSTTSAHPFEGNETMRKELEDTINSLASSQVALYPVDPRGVPVSPSQRGDDEVSPTNLAAHRLASGTSGFTPEDDAYQSSQFNEHSTMNEIADGTGGKAFYNTNDIDGALRQARDLGSNFYTLTYTPPIASRPGQLRAIAVNVKGKGLHLSYRRSYYTPELKDGVIAAMNTRKTDRAMRPMAPQSSEILFQVKPIPSTSADVSQIIGSKAPGAVSHGVFQLNLLIDLSTLHFEPGADGKMHGVLDFSTIVYDGKGKIVDSRIDRANLALDDARYKAMEKGGLHFHNLVALTDGAGTTVRVAVHDATTDAVGTVLLTAPQLREAAIRN